MNIVISNVKKYLHKLPHLIYFSDKLFFNNMYSLNHMTMVFFLFYICDIVQNYSSNEREKHSSQFCQIKILYRLLFTNVTDSSLEEVVQLILQLILRL